MTRGILVLAACMVLGCGGKVDEDQCKELTDHLVDLLAEKDPETADKAKLKASVKVDRRAEWVNRETCVGKISVAQFRCMKGAKTIDKFLACEK